MEVIEIKTMLSQPKLSDMDSAKVETFILSAVLKAYALTGLSKTYETSVLKEEALIITKEIAKDIVRETDLRGLRAPEVDYAVCAGIKGEFEVKTFGLNYQTIYKWLKAYIHSDERERAYNSTIQDRQTKQLTASVEPTQQEQRQIMINGINQAYQEYLNGETSPDSSDFGGILSKIKSIREGFLIREKVMPLNMPLYAFFQKCKQEGKTKVM